MPELPEVETIRRGLAPYLAGARLARVEARRPDLRFPLPEGFVQRLTGARVEDLTRRGKYMLAPLDRGDTLVMHLGMTGRFVVQANGLPEASAPAAPAPPADPKHAHVVFETEAGVTLTYFDPRRFGFMDLIASDTLASHPWFVGMGPEPLGDSFDAAYLARAFAGRRQGAKTLLLDQRVVAGLGNIYVCEALHRARISPIEPAGDIGLRGLRVLVRAIREVLEEAIIAGGSTLRDYASVEGALGYFQHDFRVYGREGEACRHPALPGGRKAVRPGRALDLLLSGLPNVRRALWGPLLVALMLVCNPARAQPAMWTVHGPRGEVILFGSVHLLPAGLDWRPTALGDALTHADDLWFELPIDQNTEEAARRLTDPRGPAASGRQPLGAPDSGPAGSRGARRRQRRRAGGDAGDLAALDGRTDPVSGRGRTGRRHGVRWC